MAKRSIRRKLRRLALVLYVSGIAVAVFLLPARLTSPARVIFTQVLGPAEEVSFQVGGDVTAAAGTFRDALLGHERDRALEQEVVRLRNETARLRDLQLVTELQMRSTEALALREFTCRVLSTVVTAYDSATPHQSVTIAAGTTDGVHKGLAVCSAGAVVGVVTETGPWRSRVRLITDAAGALPCRLSRTRSLCVLRGTGGANCRVEWIDRDASVESGDELVTAPVDEVAGLRPLIPPGLPVARVVQVDRPRTDDFFLSVAAAPLVNLRRLEVVEVIIPTPRPALTEQ